MCFSLAWIEQLCVWLIVIGALVAIIQLLIPYLSTLVPGIVAQIIRIVLWAVVAICVVYLVFALISCLLGAGGGLHLLPAR